MSSSRVRAGINALVCAGIFAWSLSASAMSPRTESGSKGSESAFSFGGGYGYYVKDTAFRLSAGFHFRHYDAPIGRDGTVFGRDARGPISLDIVFPFHLTTTDAGIKDPVWRSSEYDEVSEFVGILQRFEIGRPDGPVYLKLGKTGDIRFGHGTVIDRFASDLFYDHTRAGAQLSLQGVRAGAQFFADDVVAPSMLLGRAYWAPWGMQDRALRKLAFGATLAVDPMVPLRSPTTVVENPLDTSAKFSPPRDEFPGREAFVTWGVDVEYELFSSNVVTTTVYGDMIFQGGATGRTETGGHFGASLGWRVTPKTILELQGEYIPSSSGYLPVAFGRMYELNRMDRVNGLVWNRPNSIWEEPISTENGGAAHSYRLNFGLHQERIGSIRVGVDGGNRRADGSFYLKATSPEDRRVRIGIRYESTWQGKDFFHGASLATEAQFALSDTIILWGDGGRRWRFDDSWVALPHWHLMAGATFWLGIAR